MRIHPSPKKLSAQVKGKLGNAFPRRAYIPQARSRRTFETRFRRRRIQIPHNRQRPIILVPERAERTQRLLGATKLAFLLAQLVRKLDEEFAVAVALILG